VVIEVEGLRKYFEIESPLYKQLVFWVNGKRQICALKDISFCIDAGQVVGIVGPNGAGKTTLLRILADLLEPDSGKVKLCEKQLNRNNHELRRLVGYVPSDERSFFWRLSGKDNLEFFGRLYGLYAKEAKKRTSRLLSLFDFEKHAKRLFRDYSAGMRKKVAIMRALLHRPRLLLLDEVTNSLDPDSAMCIRFLVREYVNYLRGCAALWSTHRLQETTEICDRIIMIKEGRIHYDGTTNSFISE
jgi:ABC-2 type transport system ATP-binding protein